MIAVCTILYIALIILLYKVLKIRPTPSNIAAVAVLGVVMIGAIVILWMFSAPVTNRMLVSRYTVSLVPQVSGPITKIYATPNVPLKRGKDILFEIQTDTYQNTVDQVNESLQSARRNVAQLEAGAIAADAAVRKAEAGRAAAEAELAVAKETAAANPDAISKLSVRQLTESFNAADAGLDQAKAIAVQAKIGKQSAEDSARSLEAQLATARFNLGQCTVYAPADGFVTNWAVREGTMAGPTASVGTFIDTSQAMVLATYPQNVITNVQSGDVAEVTFMTRPGQVYAATVDSVIQATGEGQMPVGGKLPSAADLASQGMLVVKLNLDGEQVAAELAMGTAGTATVYTQSGKPFHVISKVTVRINAWMYYLMAL